MRYTDIQEGVKRVQDRHATERAITAYIAALGLLGCALLGGCGDRSDGLPDGSIRQPDAGPAIPTPGPLDPADIAPALSPVEETPFFESVRFLWEHDPPLQIGVVPGSLEAHRLAVVRGLVTDTAGKPLTGVRIAVHGQPQLGHTFSRDDGAFDLAVNGGGTLTITYTRDGYLPVQRQVYAPWRDYVSAPDVALTALDPAVTEIAIDHVELQVARGSMQSDADGNRQATLLIPAHTTAMMYSADGDTRPLAALAVRATEYTVGERGSAAMPGSLPATSGYTYAVELSVDEALQAGANRVEFSQPLPFFVDNYLDFPTGEIVPVGYYDRERAQWIAGDNGLIVEILDIVEDVDDQSQQVALDIDGSGTAADDAALEAMGITAAELRQLAVLYAPGQRLWRVPLHHFTPWDCNWPYGPPEDAIAPPVLAGDPDLDSGDGDCASGCVIEAQRQVVGENIPILGAPFSLHYRSHTAPGYLVDKILDIPVSGEQVPDSLQHIDLSISIAGRRIRKRYPPVP
ncbi:MAG: carboxypeptidase-like regulatory domain-containing protein, partial [Proteobacteria bacterium]|nr:carboxypeptidase-like regulatory domain-containing protein [Pseudomonadota bacterium]